MTTIVATTRTTAPGLSLPRLHAMRGGYLLMGVGLALVKWPKLPDAHTMPLYEAVTVCLLTAMSTAGVPRPALPRQAAARSCWLRAAQIASA